MLVTNTLSNPWVSLLFACGFVLFVVNGVMTGSTIVWHRRFERSEKPFLFWFSIVSCGAGALFFSYYIFGQIWRDWDDVIVVMVATLCNQPNSSFKADGFAAA